MSTAWDLRAEVADLGREPRAPYSPLGMSLRGRRAGVHLAATRRYGAHR